jgi:predicted cupin superfamily sugar epimerase
MLTKLRCRVGMHGWKLQHNPEGGWYRECRRCRKQGNVGHAVAPVMF